METATPNQIAYLTHLQIKHREWSDFDSEIPTYEEYTALTEAEAYEKWGTIVIPLSYLQPEYKEYAAWNIDNEGSPEWAERYAHAVDTYTARVLRQKRARRAAAQRFIHCDPSTLTKKEASQAIDLLK